MSNLCPSDPRPLLGLDKAWLDRPLPGVYLPRVDYATGWVRLGVAKGSYLSGMNRGLRILN